MNNSRGRGKNGRGRGGGGGGRKARKCEQEAGEPLPGDQPMAIWSGFVDYFQIYSTSRGGAWGWSVFFVASL